MQKLFKALSSEIRLRIVEILLEKDSTICYCDFVERLGKDRSVIYRHFKKLESAGLIETVKDGKKLKGRLKNSEYIAKLLDYAKKVDK